MTSIDIIQLTWIQIPGLQREKRDILTAITAIKRDRLPERKMEMRQKTRVT